MAKPNLPGKRENKLTTHDTSEQESEQKQVTKEWPYQTVLIELQGYTKLTKPNWPNQTDLVPLRFDEFPQTFAEFLYQEVSPIL